MSIIRKEQLTNPLSASYALTASHALNASTSTINTGSFVTTSSFNAFTSSINTFTSSYNTGSFSGSFTGSFNGTASWARNALTASYVSSSNVYGPNGFDSVNYATSAGSTGTATTADTANAITSPLTQNLTINGTVNINGSFSNNITYTLFDELIASYDANGPGYGYSGEVFTYESGKGGFDINLACDLNSLLGCFDGDGGWGYIEAWKTISTGMLGFFVRDPDTDESGILTEGYIVLDGTNIDSPSIGAPLWFYQEDAGGGNPVNPPLPFRTSLYSGASPFTIYQRLLGHLCYADRNNLWILRFKPSNDWIQI